jgi:uncharacterized protein RhaS with RHS repeats
MLRAFPYGYRFYSPGLGRWINRDPIGEAGGLNLYAMVGNNPTNYGDPYGLAGIQFGNGPNIGWGDPTFIIDQDALHRGGLGAQAGVDGIIPFWDPFANAGGYNPCDSDMQFSWKAGAFARDIYLMGKTPNFGPWAKNPLMYEIGQKTLAAAPEGGLTAIQMGQQLVKNKGWIKALVPEASGWRLGIGTTFHTGPTPGGWLGVGALAQAVKGYCPENNCGCD